VIRTDRPKTERALQEKNLKMPGSSLFGQFIGFSSGWFIHTQANCHAEGVHQELPFDEAIDSTLPNKLPRLGSPRNHANWKGRRGKLPLCLLEVGNLLMMLMGRAGFEPATLCLKGRYSTY
jgi:hypothetical protein